MIKKAFILSFVLMPIIILTVNLLDLENIGISIPIGIYGASNLNNLNIEDIPLAPSLIESPFINIIHYDNIENLRNDVIRGTLNFGYVLETNSQTITLITTENSFGYQIMNEIITSIILERDLEYMTINLLNFFFEEGEINTFVYDRINYYRQSENFMQPYLDSLSGSQIMEIDSSNLINHILKGLLGLVITSLLIFITPYFINEKNSGVTKALKRSKKIKLRLSA